LVARPIQVDGCFELWTVSWSHTLSTVNHREKRFCRTFNAWTFN